MTMKKKIMILLIFQNICYLLFSQQFSTKLYLQGINGGKDTLEVGYDPTATRGIDAIFGETNYLSSISNSKFQAFIVDPSILNQTPFLLKKQILNTYSGWVENGALGIIVPYDSLPIAVSWDKSLFENTERDYSLITDWTMGGWFDAGTSTFKSYLKDVSSVQIPKTVSNYTYNDGVQQHLMYIFYLAFAKEENILSGFKTTKINSNLQIYPNPASDFILINNKSIENIKQIKVFTLDGLIIEIVNGSQTKINCSNWANGLYIIKFEFEFESNKKMSYSKIQIKK